MGEVRDTNVAAANELGFEAIAGEDVRGLPGDAVRAKDAGLPCVVGVLYLHCEPASGTVNLCPWAACEFLGE